MTVALPICYGGWLLAGVPGPFIQGTTLHGARRGGGRVIARRVTTFVRFGGSPALILAVQLVLFPVPLGVWVRGAIVGGATALLALGMALIYRSNRIVNFAQGDLGRSEEHTSELQSLMRISYAVFC